ncbi:MAG: helix-turn-helix domain-containing protein [Elainellaceae cyanobacterium]
MPSLTVDFAREQEAGYRRIFGRSPLLSSVAAQWDSILVAYDYFWPGQTPEIASRQHGIGIFVDMPKPASVKRTIGGDRHHERVVQGDVVIVPAETWHQTHSEAGGGVIVLGLDPQAFARTIDETTERDGVELVPHFASADPLVHQIGLALKRALEDSKSASRLYAETMTTALMVHLLQYYCANQAVLPTYGGGLPKLKLQQVVDYIQAHLSQDLSLNELASVAQMSAHYFSQLFKQSTGLSPHQYVIHCRIKRSQALLGQGEATIAEVAKAVGFADQSHFHRHFKRLVGVTPGTFVRQAK